MLPKVYDGAAPAAIVLLKAGNPAGDQRVYRTTSLICVPFKVLERVIVSRVEPIVDPQLSREQPGFQRGSLTVDQVTLLLQDTEDSSQANEKARVVLLNLMAAQHRLAQQTSPKDFEDNPQSAYGVVENRDAVHQQFNPADQRWPARQTAKTEKWRAPGLRPLTTVLHYLHPPSPIDTVQSECLCR